MGAIETFDIRKCVTGSVIETYSTMLSMEIEPLQEEQPLAAFGQRMVGTLHFAGSITGIFHFHVALDFGRFMAANMMGVEPDEVEVKSDVRDVIAELTNIIGGNLKSSLNDAGYFCVLSTPSISYGADFTIKSLTMDRFERCFFRNNDHQLMVEVGLKALGGPDAGIDFSTPEATNRIANVDFEKLNAIDYQAKTSGAMMNVFETMFAMKIEAAETVSFASLKGLRYVSSVCFAGDATGIVSIHIDRDLSRRMTAHLLGMEPGEIEGEDEIQDMLGELGNMVGGHLKSALTDIGLHCTLSTPSVISGSDFIIETMNLDRYERTAYHAGGHSVFAEMGIKIAERITPAGPAGKTIHYKVQDSEADPESAPAEAIPTQSASLSDSATEKKAGSEIASAPKSTKPLPVGSVSKPASPPEDFALDILVDIPVELTVELGRTKLPIHDLLRLQPGSAIKLAQLDGEPVDILANDTLIARGEVVIRNEKYGIRITEITRRTDRLKGLS
jgi:flagellar motor switch protein FliN